MLVNRKRDVIVKENTVCESIVACESFPPISSCIASCGVFCFVTQRAVSNPQPSISG